MTNRLTYNNKTPFSMFYTLIKHGFLIDQSERAQGTNYIRKIYSNELAHINMLKFNSIFSVYFLLQNNPILSFPQVDFYRPFSGQHVALYLRELGKHSRSLGCTR